MAHATHRPTEDAKSGSIESTQKEVIEAPLMAFIMAPALSTPQLEQELPLDQTLTLDLEMKNGQRILIGRSD